MLERLSQFGPIVTLAGLHFGVGLQELRIGSLASNESCGGGFLRFESKAGRALLGGAHSVVGDEVATHWSLLAESPNARKGKMQAQCLSGASADSPSGSTSQTRRYGPHSVPLVGLSPPPYLGAASRGVR